MITPEQRETRRKLIGSSDAAAILGVDPFRSAMDVYLEKTNRVDPFAGNEHTARGNLLEAPLLDWIELEIGQTLIRHKLHIDGDLCANLDAEVVIDGSNVVIEGKTSASDEGYGDQFTDQVPHHVLIQVHHQFAVTKYGAAIVPVLSPGYRQFKFARYDFPCNPSLRDFVAEAGINFMERHVKRDTPPPDSIAGIETLKRMRRIPNRVTLIPDAVAEEYNRLNDARKLIEKDFEAAKQRLIAALGEAEAGEWGGGEFTYLQQTRSEYVSPRVTFRVLRKIK